MISSRMHRIVMERTSIINDMLGACAENYLFETFKSLSNALSCYCIMLSRELDT